MFYRFLFGLLFISNVYALDYPVTLGDTTVIIRQYHNGPGKTILHVHHNETTALKAAQAYFKTHGGTLITLVHKGGRNIVFRLNGQRFEFDPNRMFTDNGIKKTLSLYSTYTPSAQREVKKLAHQLLALIPPGKIIAIHNNQFYSFKDYLPKHRFANEAQALHFVDERHYRNFYVLTNRYDFTRLKGKPFNSVLQATTPSDDGSLSVYFAQREYINIEAGYNQLNAQIEMLKYA